jgi:hypothetical protein
VVHIKSGVGKPIHDAVGNRRIVLDDKYFHAPHSAGIRARRTV